MVKALLLAMPDSIPGFDVATFTPNLGIVSLAGNVDPGTCDIKVADLVLIRRGVEDYVLKLLRRLSPDVVGLSCMSFQYRSAIKLARLVKSYDKNILVVMGGYHPTLMYEEISSSPESQFIDFIVRGEGEATFKELIDSTNAGSGYDRILGLSYKKDGIFHHNPPRPLLPLDEIRLPKRDARLITRGFHAFGLPLDAIETSRGCTYNCKFCSISHMYGRSFRKYKISRVIADIEDARRYGAKAVAIMDDNITLDIERLEMLFEEILAKGLNSLHYSVQASVKGIAQSERLVKKMADAGVKLVFLGIESVSPAHLDFLRKRSTTSDDTRKAVKYLRDNGIICAGGFIVGNPDDDERSLWETFRTACELKIDVPLFFILTPHAKTEIREELIAEGLVTNPDDFSTYNGFSANIRTRYLTPKQIDRIVLDMYDAYHNRLDYVDFTQVRKNYPAYFWKLVVRQILLAVPKVISKLKKDFSGWMNTESLATEGHRNPCRDQPN